MPDYRNLTTAALERRRDDLLERLDRPRAGDDVSALTAEAEAVAGELSARSARETRNRIAGSDPVPRYNDAPMSRQGGSEPSSSEPADWLLRAVRDYDDRGGAGRHGVDLDVRAVISTTTIIASPDRLPGVVQQSQDWPSTVLDLLGVQMVNGSSLPYLADTSTLPLGATEVAEGAVKPEAALSFEERSEPIRTIAAWAQVTRQAADDEPQVLAHIQQRLMTDATARLARQVLVGDGTGANLTGLLNRSGTGTYTGTAGEEAGQVARKAWTLAQATGYRPSAVVVGPDLAEAMDLVTTTDGAWKGLPPGVPAPVVDAAMPANTMLVGDFRGSASLLLRDGARLYLSDSHASTFTSNVLTLLAEVRAGLALWRPSAFVKATVTPAV